jgi:hypothetical protein
VFISFSLKLSVLLAVDAVFCFTACNPCE